MPQKRALLTPEDTLEYVTDLRVEVDLIQKRFEKWGQRGDQKRLNALEAEIANLTIVADHMRQHRDGGA